MANRTLLRRSQPTAPVLGSLLIQSDSAFADKTDSLNFGPYAQALAFLLDQRQSRTPFIVAISAPWGAGKTTLARLVEEQLKTRFEWEDDHIICWFNAWNHDDSPNLGAAFAARVAQSANRKRPWWWRLAQPLPSAMLTPEQRWRRKLWIILGSLAAAVALVLGPDTGNMVEAAAKPTDKTWLTAVHGVQGFGLTLLVLLGGIAFIYPKVFSGAKALSRFITDPQTEAASGSIDMVRLQLRDLIKQATRDRRRFIVFVDDLERCRPPRAVEVCEVASQLLSHEGVVTVLLADMTVIARSAAIKYRALEQPGSGDDSGSAYDEYGRSYLQKIVQVQFDLPPATQDQLIAMMRIGGAGQAKPTGSGGNDPPGTGGDPPGTGSDPLAAGDGQRPGAPGRDEPGSSVAHQADPPAAPANGTQGRQPGTAATGATQPADPPPTKDDDLPYSIAFTALTLVVTAFLSWAFLNTGRAGTRVLYFIVEIPLVFLFIGSVITLVEVRHKKQDEKKRKELETAVKGQQAGTTIDQAVEQISGESNQFDEISIRRQVFISVLEDQVQSGIRDSIDRFVTGFLPERPRAAKRLVNQVRLMMPVAIARDLFRLHEGMKSEQNAFRFCKWLVLRELWPEIALTLQADEGKIAELQLAARQEKDDNWDRALKDLNIVKSDESDLLKKLFKCEPDLSGIHELAFLTGMPEPAIAPRAGLPSP
jgi:KAP-like P-loop domain-containing protein